MRTTLLAIIFVGAYFSVSAQDTTRVALRDTLETNVVHITPYFSQNIRTSGNYAKKIDTDDLLRFSSGVSIFNVLRGQVPGLVISPYVITDVPGFRYEYYSQKNATVLMDGVAYNASLVGYINFNASEYSAITGLPSPNSLSFLDLPTTGTISLTSKTGEGVDKPSFEYTTNLLAGWEERSSRSGSFTEKDWNLYSSLSYSQDFGKLDLRASYGSMNRWLRPGSFNYPMSHFLKLNTGYKLGDRGEVRTIVSTLLRKREITYSPFSMPSETINEELSQQFLTGNISLKYGLTHWLNFTGQLSFSSHDSLFYRETTQFTFSRDRNDSQVQANAYLVGKGSMGSSLKVSGFTGLQHAAMKLALTDFTGTGEQRFERTYLSGGSEISYKKYLFGNVLLKVPVSENDNLNYSISGSFIFSEVFKNLPIKYGKIRGSFGENYFTDYASYPWQRSSFILSRSVSHVTSMEWGTDFSFIDNRFSVSLTYFIDKWQVDLPGILEKKGFEADISYLAIQKPNSNLITGAVFSFFGDGDFRGSLLAQLTKGKSFVHLIIERLSIKTFTDSHNFTRLREVTVGHNITGGFLEKTWLSHINLGISARNMHDFNASKLSDFEKQNYDFIKSVNLNLAMVFQ